MVRQGRGLTTKAIEKRRKEGRGRGEGADYRPWLMIHEVPSRGQSNRPRGWKTERVHHLLSLNELRYFYLLDWSPSVVDIREQFPLWPEEETLSIAHELGVAHPSPPGSEHWVMTSDFRITLEDGKDVVRTAKPASELEDNRVIEKLEIERQYWEKRGVDWGIVLADELPLPLVSNIQWLHGHLTLERVGLDPQDAPAIAAYLTEEVRSSREDSLADVARRCDEHLGLPRNTALALARHLLATRQWKVDMNVKINPSRPLTLLDAEVA